MEKILAQRLVFCDFSQIVGFPNALPDRDIWEDFLPEFHAKEWEEPAEHLLDFHEAIHRHHITHEDVQIKLFRYSLKGAALDWCRSLPPASICSLAGFHTAFHSFCQESFPAARLYERCCEDFSLLHKASAGPEDHVRSEAFTVEEIICCESIEVLNDIGGVNSRMEASDIISDASALLDVREDQHTSYEDYEFAEQTWSVVDGSPKCRVGANIPSNPVFEGGDRPICKEEVVLEEEQVAKPYPLLAKEDYHGEISHSEQQLEEQSFPMVPIYDDYESDPWESYEEQEEDQRGMPFIACTEVTEQSLGEHDFPTGPVYDGYESDPWESQEEEAEPEEQPKMQFTYCAKPVSEKLPPEISEPTSVIHPPLLI